MVKSYDLCWVMLIFVLLFATKQQIHKFDLISAREYSYEFEKELNNLNLTRVVDFYCDDSMLLPSEHTIVNGKENIKTFWTNPGYTELNISHDEMIFDGSGKFAYQISNNYCIHATTSNQQINNWGPGKFVRIWEKQSDSRWKIKVEIWNANPNDSHIPR